MSTQVASRVNPDPCHTLADVVAAVRSAALPPRRRQEIAAALRTAARALGRPPERVPADPRRLAALLAEVAPLAIGLSPGRWANVRSLVGAAWLWCSRCRRGATSPRSRPRGRCCGGNWPPVR